VQTQQWAAPGQCPYPNTFYIYNNDQAITAGTQAFMYVDDICATAQTKGFDEADTAITGALGALSLYYCENHLRANSLTKS